MELFRCRKCGSIYGQKESECLRCGHKDFIVFEIKRYGIFTHEDDNKLFEPGYDIDSEVIEDETFQYVYCGKVYKEDERPYVV